MTLVRVCAVADVPDGTSFEQALAELERCVDVLEAGDVGLEEAVVLFRRGAALERWCEGTLDGIAPTATLNAAGIPVGPLGRANNLPLVAKDQGLESGTYCVWNISSDDNAAGDGA